MVLAKTLASSLRSVINLSLSANPNNIWISSLAVNFWSCPKFRFANCFSKRATFSSYCFLSNSCSCSSCCCSSLSCSLFAAVDMVTAGCKKNDKVVWLTNFTCQNTIMTRQWSSAAKNFKLFDNNIEIIICYHAELSIEQTKNETCSDFGILYCCLLYILGCSTLVAGFPLSSSVEWSETGQGQIWRHAPCKNTRKTSHFL